MTTKLDVDALQEVIDDFEERIFALEEKLRTAVREAADLLGRIEDLERSE